MVWISDKWLAGYSDILVLCVFRPRNGGISFLKTLLPKLWRYVAGIGRNHGISVVAAGGIANHAHSLIALPPDMPAPRRFKC